MPGEEGDDTIHLLTAILLGSISDGIDMLSEQPETGVQAAEGDTFDLVQAAAGTRLYLLKYTGMCILLGRLRFEAFRVVYVVVVAVLGWSTEQFLDGGANASFVAVFFFGFVMDFVFFVCAKNAVTVAVLVLVVLAVLGCLDELRPQIPNY